MRNTKSPVRSHGGPAYYSKETGKAGQEGEGSRKGHSYLDEEPTGGTALAEPTLGIKTEKEREKSK